MHVIIKLFSRVRKERQWEVSWASVFFLRDKESLILYIYKDTLILFSLLIFCTLVHLALRKSTNLHYKSWGSSYIMRTYSCLILFRAAQYSFTKLFCYVLAAYGWIFRLLAAVNHAGNKIVAHTEVCACSVQVLGVEWIPWSQVVNQKGGRFFFFNPEKMSNLHASRHKSPEAPCSCHSASAITSSGPSVCPLHLPATRSSWKMPELALYL